jgi:hypothetical protein
MSITYDPDRESYPASSSIYFLSLHSDELDELDDLELLEELVGCFCGTELLEELLEE